MSAALKADNLSPNARKVLAWTAKGEALNALPMSLPDLAKALRELSGRGLDEHGAVDCDRPHRRSGRALRMAGDTRRLRPRREGWLGRDRASGNR